MAEIQSIYTQLLSIFPAFLHPFVSVALAIFIIYALVQVVKQNFIYLIVLVVLLPASIPILKGVGDGIVTLIKFLLAGH